MRTPVQPTDETGASPAPAPNRSDHQHHAQSTSRSNGRLERLNSRIRLISHRSFGFHSANPLIALVYLCCTGIVIQLPR
ncbi:MAG: transposase [Actinobacteria bacterium]|nr:transposase [Actinomycetota bacterium]